MANTLTNINNTYHKRIKFYYKTAQVYRVFHGIYSPDIDAISGIGTLKPTSDLNTFVEAYTSLLYEYINDIKYDTGLQANSERALFLNIASLWHLFQILFFSGDQNEISINLMKWLNQVDKKSILKFDIQGVFNYSIPSNHHLFWPLVYKLTLRGELDVLIQLLEITSQKITNDDEKSILKILISSLQSYQHSIPDNNNISNNNNNKESYTNQRRKWNSAIKQMQAKITSLKISTSSTVATHAIHLLQIMSGDLKQIYHYSTSFIEAIISSIYYNNDMIYLNNNKNKNSSSKTSTSSSIKNTFKHIQMITQQLRNDNNNNNNNNNNNSISNKNHHHQNNELDQQVGIITLLQGNVYATLEQCSRLDWWILAHMTDVLDRYTLQNDSMEDDIFNNQPLYIHMGDEHQLAEIETRAYFIISYADTLVIQKDMWKIAFDYMSTCGMTGRNQINKAIGNVPLINDDISKELADYCTQHGLIQIRQQLYKKLALRYIDQGLYDKAIYYNCLLGDFSNIDSIFELLLKKYFKTKELIYLDDLDPSYKDLCSGIMAKIYFDYCQIHTLTTNEEYNQALQLMNRLLTWSKTPLYILPILFMESIVLLKENTEPLSKEMIDSLQHRLHKAVIIKNIQGVELLVKYLNNEDKKEDYDMIIKSLIDIYLFILKNHQ
ncbi:unnamed protein product [Cunninghamella blakesleeana]